MSVPGLRVERPRPGVALLVLDRPAARNALSTALLDGLIATLGELAADPGVRCAVIAGEGRGFCAGADLRELRAMDDAAFAAYVDRYRLLSDAIRDLGCPLVAAVHGFAVAGGFELMCLCDLRVVAADARLRVGDLELGLSPTSGLTWLLPRLVGAGRARHLLLAGPVLDGAGAVAIGLADEHAPAGGALPRALEIAERIAAHPGDGVRRTRELLESAATSTRAEAIAAELVAESETFAHPDARAAIEAFFTSRGSG